MIANHEKIDGVVVGGDVVLAIAGLWCYAYYAKYEVVLADDGFTVRGLARKPESLASRDVRTAAVDRDNMTFETTDQRKITISILSPGTLAIAEAATRNLPEAAFAPSSQTP